MNTKITEITQAARRSPFGHLVVTCNPPGAELYYDGPSYPGPEPDQRWELTEAEAEWLVTQQIADGTR